MPNQEKRGKINQRGDLQSEAIKAGLNHLIYSNPHLKEYTTLITKGLDYNKIGNFVEKAKEELSSEESSPEEKAKLLYTGLANYIASGKALKDKTIQTLFDESQEGKLDKNVLEKIVDFFKPNKFEGDKYFEKARNAYGDMYDILSQNELAQKKIPELTKAAESMKMYGFLDVALKNFKAHEMLDDKTYKMLSQELYKKTAIDAEKGKKGLEEYILSGHRQKKEEEAVHKTAAAIFLIFGIALLTLTGVNLTGNVIGTITPTTSGILSIVLIVIALSLFFLFKRHSK